MTPSRSRPVGVGCQDAGPIGQPMLREREKNNPKNYAVSLRSDQKSPASWGQLEKNRWNVKEISCDQIHFKFQLHWVFHKENDCLHNAVSTWEKINKWTCLEAKRRYERAMKNQAQRALLLIPEPSTEHAWLTGHCPQQMRQLFLLDQNCWASPHVGSSLTPSVC